MESSDKTPSPFVADFYRRVMTEALPRIVRATVPFYAVQNDSIVRDRSGVLLKIADEFFILTASHDLRKIVQASIALYVGWDAAERIPVPITDGNFHTTEENRRDLGLIRLSQSEAQQVMSSSEAIQLRDIAFQEDRQPGLFIICGYPKEWLKVLPDRIESDPLAYLCQFYTGERPSNSALETDFQFDDTVNVLFGMQRDAIKVDGWKNENLPAVEGIKGISGCGIWRVTDLSYDKIKSWTPDDCKLVAIQHRYAETRGYVCATWVKYALANIAREYPQLTPAMNLVFP